MLIDTEEEALIKPSLEQRNDIQLQEQETLSTEKCTHTCTVGGGGGDLHIVL